MGKQHKADNPTDIIAGKHKRTISDRAKAVVNKVKNVVQCKSGKNDADNTTDTSSVSSTAPSTSIRPAKKHTESLYRLRKRTMKHWLPKVSLTLWKSPLMVTSEAPAHSVGSHLGIHLLRVCLQVLSLKRCHRKSLIRSNLVSLFIHRKKTNLHCVIRSNEKRLEYPSVCIL